MKTTINKDRQRKLLQKMMRSDEELGIYDEGVIKKHNFERDHPFLSKIINLIVKIKVILFE